jgi:biotin carboxylase
VPRVLLLVPSFTYRAADFVHAAAALGAEVVVGSDHRQALAAAMGDRAVVVDLRDVGSGIAAIIDLHQRSPVAAVLAVDDLGVVGAAAAAARLGLLHNPPEAVARTRNKAIMRQALAAAGVRQPEFVVVDAGDTLIAPSYPAVVKPLTLSASQGVIRVDGPDELAATVARVRAICARHAGGADTDTAPVLIEEFVAGAEVAVEGLLRDGALEVLAVFDKPDPLDGPYFEETIYVTPSRLSLDGVADLVQEACAALGLREGPVHAEVRIGDGGRLSLVEVAARSIGGLCSRALKFGAGISLEEVILRHALGLPTDNLSREQAASGVMMLPIREGGRLDRVDGQDAARSVPGIVGLEITIPKGRELMPLPEGDRYLGFLFARGDTAEEVEASLRDAHSRLTTVVT